MSVGKKKRVQGYQHGITKNIVVRGMPLGSHCHKECIQTVLCTHVFTGRMTVTRAKTKVYKWFFCAFEETSQAFLYFVLYCP